MELLVRTKGLNRNNRLMEGRVRLLISSFGWLMLFLVLMVCGTGSARAEASTDTLPGGDNYISGPSMVWHANDADGLRQIYYKNLNTGETKQITSTAGYKTFPKVSGDLVVWQEKRDVDKDKDWNVYAYHIPTGTEKKLNAVPGIHIEPTTDGRYVAWQNNNVDADMYVYDWTAGTLNSFGKGRNPIVVQGNILFKQQFGTGMDLYTITTGETKTVLPNSKTEYVSWFAFNGKTALFVLNAFNRETKVAMLNVQAERPTPKDLTSYTKKQRDFGELVVGDNYVAWMEDKNGVAQIMGADISTGLTEQLTHGTSDQRPLAMLGDVLVYTKDYSTVDRMTVAMGPSQPQPQPDTGKRGRGSGAVVLEQKPSEVKGTIGPDGGRVQSDDGKAIIEFAGGAFSKQTELGLRSGIETGVSELDRNGSLKLMSAVWEVSMEEKPGKPGTLTLGYDGSGLHSEQAKKLGIYRYDLNNGTWQYVGGRVDEASQIVRADLASAGVYAVLLHSVTFKDMEGHWARQPVEVLAARWIVNGMEENAFYPDAKLTRAQFTKMLSAALGIAPVHGGAKRFSDVPAEYWGYGWIEAAARAGLVEGSGGGFQPDAELTREQMMAMLIRAVGTGGAAVQPDSESAVRVHAFADAAEISPWAKEYAERAIQLGLVEGSEGKLHPRATSTRAEAAAVMYRLLTKQDKL